MKAIVVFSGGQDSTTCLGWACQMFKDVEAITFFYGQKHAIEIEQSKKICEEVGVKQTLVDISFLDKLVDSALTSGGDVNEAHARLTHLPASFVPNRNALFLTLAHAYAQKVGALRLVTGVTQSDFSGYPDCREVFIKSIEASLNLASDAKIRICTPLMFLTKAQTFKLSEELGILKTVIEMSHTCYEGDRTHLHDYGYGCGECPACKLREKGWLEYQKSKEVKNE